MVDESHSTSNGSALPAVLEAARLYHGAGLCVIPIKPDGSKAPAVSSWKQYQDPSKAPTQADLDRWFRDGRKGLAVLGGKASGNLDCIDFDREAESIFPAWCELVEFEAPGLIARLSIARTPKQGFHVRYRCLEMDIPGNTKLAMDPDAPKDGQVLIETRGEGGYALAPGCPAACHETGRTYDHHAGPKLSHVQTINAAERDTLIRAARSFDRSRPVHQSEAGPAVGEGDRPGDDFNRRGPSLTEILCAKGWVVARQLGPTTYLRRPGKEIGWSATAGYCKDKDGNELLAVFSSNAAPFEGPAGGKSCTCYSKFAAFALLHHQGDFSAAAQALAEQGYGSRRKRPSANGGGSGPNGKAQAAEVKEFQLGPLTLRPGIPRRTPTKISVPVTVLKAGHIADRFTLSNSVSGRKDADRILSAHLDEDKAARKKVPGVVVALIAAAVEDLERGPVLGLPTMQTILAAKVPAALQLAFRTERGAWSEARGVEITRGDVCSFFPSGLLEAVATAADAPRDDNGLANRYALLRTVKAEMEVLWSDLMGSLPDARGARLTEESSAAVCFRSALQKIWHAPKANRRVKHGKDEDVMVITGSLASWVKVAVRECLVKYQELERAFRDGPGRWLVIHSPLNAWWRVGLSSDGEYMARLAMRWELTSQIGIELPGVKDQNSLTELGRAFKVLDPDPGLPVRLSGGRRLAALSVELTRELLEDPPCSDDEPDPTSGEKPVTPKGGCH